MSPNQQCQSSEGRETETICIISYSTATVAVFV